MQCPTKIPVKFFTDLEKMVLNFIWKSKIPRIAKTILYNRGISGGFTIPDFKLYFRAAVLKTALYCLKNIKTGGPVELNQRPKYQSTHL